MSRPVAIGYVSSADVDWPSHADMRLLLERELLQRLGRRTKLIPAECGPNTNAVDWRRATLRAIDKSSFLIPIITPAFIASPQCAFEVEAFLGRQSRLRHEYPDLGGERLIFPIYLQDIEGAEPREGEMLAKLKALPWVDVREGTPAAADSERGRNRLYLLAMRIERPFRPKVEIERPPPPPPRGGVGDVGVQPVPPYVPNRGGVGGRGIATPARIGVGGGGHAEPHRQRSYTDVSGLVGHLPPAAPAAPAPVFMPADNKPAGAGRGRFLDWLSFGMTDGPVAPPPDEREAKPGFFGRIRQRLKGDGGAGDKTSVLKDVDLAVFAPPSLVPGEHFVVEVWLSAPAEHAAMVAEATRGGLGERASRSNLKLETGTVVTARLSLPGFTIDDPVQSVGWAGEIANAAFIVNAPSSLSLGGHTGTIRLEKAGLPFATLSFTLQISSEAGARPAQPLAPVETRTQHIRRAFASYASADRPEVLRRVQGMAAIGVKVFLDVTRLRAGDDWESRLFGEIDRSDRLFLFWSSKAAGSDFVDREWRYALDRHGADFIEPVPLEDPRCAVPPQELAGKHFNDVYLAFIAAEETLGPSRRRPK